MGQAAVAARVERQHGVPTIVGTGFDEQLEANGLSLFAITEETRAGKRVVGYVILPTEICRPASQNCVRPRCATRVKSFS